MSQQKMFADEEYQTLYAEECPARMSVSQENEQDYRRETAQDSGLKCSDSLATYDPNTHSWKTSQVCLVGELEEYSETFPKSGMTLNGKLYRRQHSEHLTNATESSLWRTPDANCGNRGNRSREAYLDCVKNGTHTVNLIDQVKHGLLPTPTASDGDQGAILNENTKIIYLKSGKPRKISNQGVSGSVGLSRYMQLLPTPTTQDAKNNGSKSQAERNSPPLNAVVGGKLNANFVEYLMGYPQEWTNIDETD